MKPPDEMHIGNPGGDSITASWLDALNFKLSVREPIGVGVLKASMILSASQVYDLARFIGHRPEQPAPVAFVQGWAVSHPEQSVGAHTLYGLDQRGRLWCNTYSAGGGWDGWELFDMPTEPSA